MGKREIRIARVIEGDFNKIKKSNFYFDWRTEREHLLYKLSHHTTNEILGLMSLIPYPQEQRFEVNLLAVSRPNRGKGKTYEGIAGHLLAFACREALRRFGVYACVSLVPKTELKAHYMRRYGMQDAGRQVFLEGPSLLKLINDFDT